jgi:serine-type D-Ala-D-Ala carboxypeptidase/endopeptidase (penicillin-binding protein 4)
MRIFFLWAFIFCACSPSHFITKEIKETENQLHGHVGFYLYDLSSKKAKFDYNGSKYFTPASNTKIVTFYTSLHLLGDSVKSFRYVKRNDSLIVHGLGDPSFLYKSVFDNGRTFQFLQQHQGKIFLASDFFKTESYGAGWAWDDYNDYYAAERSGFPIYGNVISIKKVNENFNFQPLHFGHEFQKSNEQRAFAGIKRDFNSNRLTYFEGKKMGLQWTIPFRTSNELTIKLLSDTLHRNIEQISWPKNDSSQIFNSIPADSLYKVMMQKSDNFIAEQLLLQCAAVVSDTLKPEIAIQYSTKKFLADLPDKPVWVDGSGLSRYNLFTPRSIVTLWNKTHELVPEDRLFKLLAVNGRQGTLRNFLKTEPPIVFGKTGFLSNNYSVSGYLVTKRGKIFTFSLMNSNFVSSTAELRKQMEKILMQVRNKY